MSDKTKFTKGEWVACLYDVTVDDGAMRWYVMSGHTEVAIDIESKHDAHLIKTAPKLYAEIESDIESLCLRPYLTKYVALTSLKEEQINTITMHVVKELIWLIAKKYKEWDFDKRYRGNLVAMVETQVKVQLNRAKNGATLNYRSDMMSYNDQYAHDEVRPEEIGAMPSFPSRDDVKM